MKKSIAITLIVCMLFIVSCTTEETPAEPTKAPAPTTKVKENNSSDHINVMMRRADNWEKIVDTVVIDEEFLKKIDGSTATVPITSELYRQFFDYDDSYINDTVYHSTTHNAYMNLIDKKETDIIFVTEPSKDELKTAKKKGIELDVVPIVKEGFVFIVNKDNPVESLTTEQIVKIYTDEYTNWKDLGGEDKDILAYQREPNSGSQTAMEQMVMKGKKMKHGLNSNTISGMGELVSAVSDFNSKNLGSIGYSYYYYLNNLYKSDHIKVLNIDGISPEDENLISGKYPFTTGYYAVIRKDESSDSPARKLRDWFLTDEGQEVLSMAGYCKIK